MKPITIAETYFIMTFYPIMPLPIMRRVLNRSNGSIKTVAYRLGLKKKYGEGRVKYQPSKLESWDDEKIDSYKSLYPVTSDHGIAKMFGISESTARKIAVAIGVKKDAEFIKSFYIKPGNVPWTKGRRQSEFMSPEAIERTKATRFKKGQLPKGTLFDGAIVVRHAHKHRNNPPYKWIRISKSKWEMLHVHVWKKHYGDIPAGKIIVFKDRNTMNCDIKNLEMISRQQNMIRNSIHRYPQELKNTMMTIGALNRKINSYEKQNGRPQKPPVRTA